jgi:hypothetical protein
LIKRDEFGCIRGCMMSEKRILSGKTRFLLFRNKPNAHVRWV